MLTMWSVITECAYQIAHLHICSKWLIKNKSKYPEFNMCYSDETWDVDSARYKCYRRVVCHHRMHILDSSFAFLSSLANNNKAEYPDFNVGHSDGTLYVVRNTLKYYQCVLLLLMHMLISSIAYLF